MRQPIITFQSTDGREITFTSRIHAAGMPRPGALVEVFHDPARSHPGVHRPGRR